jgi:hypothetical protein
MSRVRSLGLRTDLMVIGWDGVIDDFAGALRVRTPSNPDYFYGNFLLFPDAPAPGDGARWTEAFAAAFADDPQIRHVCLLWDRSDGARGAAEEFVERGLVLEEALVLATSSPLPAPPAVDVVLRRIEGDAEWEAVTALQIATTSEAYGPESEAFARRHMARARRMVDAGRSAWFGAFDGDRLAADMGVVVEDGLGRFQSVETAHAYRRRGICRALLHHVSREAFTAFGARDLVIVGVAGPTSDLYRRAGFVERERIVSALRRPPDP